jgi:hypothetical protein
VDFIFFMETPNFLDLQKRRVIESQSQSQSQGAPKNVAQKQVAIPAPPQPKGKSKPSQSNQGKIAKPASITDNDDDAMIEEDVPETPSPVTSPITIPPPPKTPATSFSTSSTAAAAMSAPVRTAVSSSTVPLPASSSSVTPTTPSKTQSKIVDPPVADDETLSPKSATNSAPNPSTPKKIPEPNDERVVFTKGDLVMALWAPYDLANVLDNPTADPSGLKKKKKLFDLTRTFKIHSCSIVRIFCQVP